MLKRLYIRYIWLASILLFSCRSNTVQPNSYFDSLVVAQAAQLSVSKASLTKHATFDNKEVQSAFTPSGNEWENELGVFRQLSSFQSPAFRTYYRVDDGITDPSSNLLVRRYYSGRDIPVTELSFYYFHQFGNLRKIEGVYHQKNLLYSTTRRVSMEFEEAGGRLVLSSYQIAGTQKMILNDSVKFLIRSEIVN